MTEPPAFFSIVSANYLAYANTLMQSVRQHHPDADRYVFLADEDPGDLGVDPDLFTLVPVGDIGIPHLSHFAFRYSILEFNTAIKPFAFRWLAAAHPSQAIVYLDPDIFVVAPLNEVLTATAEGALAVVTPHLTAPLADDSKRPDELGIMRVGVYNLGFIAMGSHPSRPALIDWWADKLERSGYIDLESGLFTDQRWIDLVPGLFPDVAILRHPGYNVAYWNLPHREITSAADGTLMANAEPLSFVHFSGADVRHPEVFSIYQSRFDANRIGALRPLYLRYLELLRQNGHERYSRIPYAWARLRDGTAITPAMRAVFRQRYDIGRPHESPDPFGLTAGTFDDGAPLVSRISRYALRQYPRARALPPLRWALNRMSPETRWRFRRFLTRRSTAPVVRVTREAARPLETDYPMSRATGLETHPRANVIGHFKGEFGVAEAARSLVRAAETCGVELALINVDAGDTAREQDLRLAAAIGNVAPHPINVLCVNADEVESLMALLGPSTTGGRYNVGYWFWELAHFPSAWQASIDLVDEIWVATDFVREGIAASTSKPVRTMRVAVDATPSRSYRRSDFELPDDRFVFLFSFDFRSFPARKNPLAAVAAFRSAFPPGEEGVALVLKSTNGQRSNEYLRRLQAALDGDRRIRLLDGFMSRDEMFGLESVVDSYVSLHRSEGFGLGLAESMFLGKPVIGTAYSGNMEFMDAGNSCLVGYRLVDVKPGEYPHPEGQAWAEPDVDQAAYHMRRLFEDRAFGDDLGRRARAHMVAEFGAEAVGKRISAEVSSILEMQAST